VLSVGPTERQPGARRTQRSIVAAGSVAFVVIGTLLQLPRQSGVAMWRTVWAEDGALFYNDALTTPLRENLLESYAGYAHASSRILVAIGVHLPPEWFSYYATLTASFIAALLALFVYFASRPLLRSPVRQGVLAVALLFWPVLPFEISGVICNLIWVMPVACLLAVAIPVERPIAVAVRVPIVVLAPLSSPLCVLFVPIAVWQVVHWFRVRGTPWRLVVPVGYVVAACVQLGVWLTAPQNPTSSEPVGDFAADVSRLYSTKVTTEFLFGVRVTDELWSRFHYGLAIVSVLLLAAMITWRFVRGGFMARWTIGVCVVASVAIYVGSIWQRQDFIAGMVIPPSGAFHYVGMRYELFPAALLLLALLIARELPRGVFTEPSDVEPSSIASDVATRWPVLVFAGVWMLVAFVPSYRLTNLRSTGPDWVLEVEAAQEVCRITGTDPASAREIVEISPPPPPLWAVSVACSELAARVPPTVGDRTPAPGRADVGPHYS
jgi:hypothetical protein